MAGYKRNKRGQFLKGFSGMSAVRKKKFLSANKSATKARMDKQNLITRGSFDGSEAFPVRTNVKSISNGGKTARLAKATSPRTVQVGNNAPVEVKKGQLLADLNVGLSKNQKARVDDYMARPKRLKAGAAKKKAAFANDGKARTGQPAHKPKSLEGRDPRGMTSAEKVEAYKVMHGKAPSAAQAKKLQVAGDNSTPRAKAGGKNPELARQEAELRDLEARYGKDSFAVSMKKEDIRQIKLSIAQADRAKTVPKVKEDNSTPLTAKKDRITAAKPAKFDRNAAIDSDRANRALQYRQTLKEAQERLEAMKKPSPQTAKKDRITAAKVARRQSGRPTRIQRLDAKIQRFHGRPGEQSWQTNRRVSARADAFRTQAKVGKADTWGDRPVTLKGKKVGSIRKRTEGEPIMNGRIKVGSTAAKGFYLKHGRQTRHTSDNRVGNALEQLSKLRDSTAALNAREAKSAIKRKKTNIKAKSRVSTSGGRVG